MDRAVHEVFSDELGALTISMLSKPYSQIVGDADIERPFLRLANPIADCAHFALLGKNADANRWVLAFAGTTEQDRNKLRTL